MAACDQATAAILKAQEEELLNAMVRRNAERLTELMAEDFREFGSSGRMFTREQMIASLAEEKATAIELDDFAAEKMADGCVLVTYRAYRYEDDLIVRQSLRSSIWTRRNGRWRMVFHQGTTVAAASGANPGKPDIQS